MMRQTAINDEAKAALDLWGGHIERLVGANVVAMRAG